MVTVISFTRKLVPGLRVSHINAAPVPRTYFSEVMFWVAYSAPHDNISDFSAAPLAWDDSQTDRWDTGENFHLEITSKFRRLP